MLPYKKCVKLIIGNKQICDFTKIYMLKLHKLHYENYFKIFTVYTLKKYFINELSFY